MNNYSDNETINAGIGRELSTKTLTELVIKMVGYEGEIKWELRDVRKLLVVSRATKLGWSYRTNLKREYHIVTLLI